MIYEGVITLFYITLISGILILIIGFRKTNSQNTIAKFLNKEGKGNKRKLVNYIAYFFRNVYSPDEGLIRKGMIIMLLVVISCIIINHLSMKFPVILVLIGSIVLGTLIVNAIRNREIRNDFDRNFQEALVILNGAISTGGNITQALRDCSNQVNGVLKNELVKIVRALDIGDDPSKVFDASFKRLPFKNYYFFLTSLNVSMTSGARLKEVLSRLTTTTTKAKAIEKKKNAMTSEVRMSSKITIAIPFVFLLIMKFISPENFDYIMHDDRGRYILYYFLGSELIGILIITFLMRKI